MASRAAVSSSSTMTVPLRWAITATGGRRSRAGMAAARGTVTENMEPRPGVESSRSGCSSSAAARLTMESPRPSPLLAVCARCCPAARIPRTPTGGARAQCRCPCRVPGSRPARRAGGSPRTMRPVVVYFTALASRFDSRRPSSSASLVMARRVGWKRSVRPLPPRGTEEFTIQLLEHFLQADAGTRHGYGAGFQPRGVQQRVQPGYPCPAR